MTAHRPADPSGTRTRRPARSLAAAAAAVVLVSLPLAGLTGQQGTRPDTREQLTREMHRLERIVSRGGNEDSVKVARQRLSTIRTRLNRGDFDPGDVVRLYVQSDTALNGDFRVNADRMLELPTIDDVDLDGVLYSEADSVVRAHLGRYLKDTRIRVRVTRRIAVLGAVQRPGFYDLPPGSTLSEAIMRAGGPAGQAKLEEVELRRNGRDLLADRNVNVQRVTLADLGPGSNDELYVPQSGGGVTFMGVLGFVSALGGTAWAVSRIF